MYKCVNIYIYIYTHTQIYENVYYYNYTCLQNIYKVLLQYKEL